MKLLTNLLVSVFVASSAFAQGVPVMNTDAATTLFGTNLGAAGFSVSSKGELFVAPSSSASPTSFLFAYGSVPSSFFTSVSAADVVDTASTLLRAAVGGSRHYVANWTCSNTSATGSRISLLDGATVVANAYLPANGGFSSNFPIPIRGSTNTAMNIQLATVATATRCSIAGLNNGW